jgi:hypothetical protein
MYMFFLDTNRINARNNSVHMNELEQLASKGLCELLMPKIAWEEAEAGDNINRKEKTWGYYFIGLTFTDSQKYWYEKIERIVFPNGARTQQEINDIWIMVTAREMNYPLVTNDGGSKTQPGGILGNRERLGAIGVNVLLDYEAVALIKKIKTPNICVQRSKKTPVDTGR